MALSRATLLPALRPTDWCARRGLSDDGFCDTVATISLSHDLCATFVCDDVDVSYRGLGELDLSAHRAWDLAARNLVDLAQTGEGIRVLTRPSSGGLQVAMPGAPATSWLAHPHTMTILDGHLTRLVGGPVVWWVASTDKLVALPREGDFPDAGTLVEWRHGFPAPVSGRTPVPTPA